MAKKKNTKTKSKSKVSKSAKASNVAKSSITNVINAEVIVASLSTVNQPIFFKVCRLCESKDGPFLNIFDSEKITAKKIEELMPFWVAENDDLPHKICFRCSAKVEELYEFVQKCIRTQENLRKLLGKNESLPVKTKTRALWEEKLNRSNMSNDDICDALIKKAMEGIKDIPRLPSIENDKPHVSNRLSKIVDAKPESQKPQKSEEEDDNITLKEIKVNKVNENSQPTYNVRSTRRSSGNIEAAQDECQSLLNDTPQTRSANKQQSITKTSTTNDKDLITNKPVHCSTEKQSDSSSKEESSESNKDTVTKSFDIMDHISMIKVNGVGILFQCKLCNRNFLKKDVVMSHACAKTGVPKIDISNMYMPPEPPKVTTVKYINTKVSSDDKSTTVEQKTDSAKSNTTTACVKKKIGPASKIGRRVETSQSTSEDQQTSKDSSDSNIISNSVQGSASEKAPVFILPSAPSLNIRYKLVPGPNNTFTLVEEKTSPIEGDEIPKQLAVPENTTNGETSEIIDLVDSPANNRCKGASKTSKRNSAGSRAGTQTISGGQSEPESSTVEQPYPVGLFQTVRHHSASFNHSMDTQQVPFTTPAMKKQSYTVVQTGNPSKLLISTKPQQVHEEPPKKRPKRAKPAPKNDSSSQEPFSIILEDATPPKDPGFFSFINVDPLLQPSYVLPTDNIIQESQITTSTLAKREADNNKDKDNKYTCTICGEKFNREKKLNAHIYAHYNVEEDTPQEERTRKRSRK